MSLKTSLTAWLAAFGLALAAMAAPAAAADDRQAIALWAGKPPGTDAWTQAEVVRRGPGGEILGYVNVRDASLTVYLPDPAKANGAAAIILPGGGLRMLSWDTPVKTAEWLNARGVAAFVLKYRTLQVPPPTAGTRPPGPGLPTQLVIRNANANPDPGNKALDEVLTMGVADAQAAMRLVRRNAAQWKVDPARVGMIGFSAGGGVAIGAALAPRTDASPDFLVSLYGPSLQDVNTPSYAPPLLMIVGADHQPVANGLVALHAAWKAAGKSSELHIYDRVPGPFSFSGPGSPPGWTDRMWDWMGAHGVLSSRPAN